MNTDNYYTILGVAKDASQDDIKRAYRKKAKEFHPDVNKAPEAQDMMKKVNAAYDVLSDPQKKQHYDRFGQNPQNNYSNQSQYQGNTQYQGYGFDNSMFEEMFRQFYQQSNAQQQQYRQQRRVVSPFMSIIRFMIMWQLIGFLFNLLFSW